MPSYMGDVLNEDDDCFDDVSVTSTVQSEVRETYPVDRILAERDLEKDDLDVNGNIVRDKQYLVKWEGYPETVATWEPETNFVDEIEQTKLDWQTYQIRVARGLPVEWHFDLEAWEAKVEEEENERALRHERRRKKRIKLGIPVSPLPVHEETLVPESPNDISDDGAPLVQRVRINVNDDSDSDVPIPTKRRRLEQTDQSAKKETIARNISKGQAIPVTGTHRAQGPSRKTHIPTTQKPNSFFDTLRKHNTAVRTNSRRIGNGQQDNPIKQTVLKPDPAPAMHTGPFLRPSKGLKKSATSKTKPSVTGADIFAGLNKAVERNRKKTTSALVTKYKNSPTLATLNRIKKASRFEAAPSVTNIPLRNLTTGETTMVKALQKISQVLPANILTTAAQNSNKEDHYSPTNHVLEADGRVHETPKSSSCAQPAKESDTERSLAPYMCWYWRNFQYCKFGSSCAFKHEYTGNPAPERNELGKADMTCRFWYNGSCYKSAEQCRYSHNITRYLAPMGSLPMVPLDQQSAHPTSGTNRTILKEDVQATIVQPVNDGFPDENADSEPQLSKVVLKHNNPGGMTCWFWYYNNHCNKSEEECIFLHKETDWIAGRQNEPPTWLGAQTREQHPSLLGNQSLYKNRTPVRDLHARVETPTDRESNSKSPPAPQIGHDHDLSTSALEAFPFSLHSSITSLPLRTEETHSMISPNKEEGAIEICLRIQPEGSNNDHSLDITAMIVGLSAETKSKFYAEVGRAPKLVIKHICVAETAQAFLDMHRFQIYGAGEVVAVQDASALELVSNNLKLHSGGAIVHHPQFTMILYPVGQSTWDFMGSGVAMNQSSQLRCQIMSPFLLPSEDSGDSTSTTLMKPEETPKLAIARIALKLDNRRLFGWINSKVQKNVFLMFHSRHQDAIEYLSQYFQSCGARVFLASIAGSWSFYCKKINSGVVLFHPDFVSYHQIPDLYAKMDNAMAQINFFEISFLNIQATPSKNVDASVSNFSLTRLFPHGRAVYIMDDCFTKEPNATFTVVEKILANRIRGDPYNTRILGRPGLFHWLFDLAVKEGGSTNVYTELDALLKSFLELKPTAFVTGYDGDQPIPDYASPVYFDPVYILPAYSEMWKRNQHEANDFMANWFAAWANEHVRELRNFVILSMEDEKTKSRWKSSYGHLDVLSPSGYLYDDARKNLKKTK